jgi:hypothetical protein
MLLSIKLCWEYILVLILLNSLESLTPPVWPANVVLAGEEMGRSIERSKRPCIRDQKQEEHAPKS